MIAMLAASVLALSQITPGTAAAVCGLPGSGKTRDTQIASKAWPRSVTLDPYARRDRLNAAAGDTDTHPWPGRLVTVLDLCRDVEAAQHGERPSLLDAPHFQYVVQPVPWKVWRGKRAVTLNELDPEGLGAQFTLLAELCWSTGNQIVIVAEEAGLYSRASADIGLRVATGGRHAKVAMVALSQSIGRLHIDYRRTMGLLCTGCQNEPIDVESIRDRCGEAFAAQCAALPKGAPLMVWRSGATAPSETVATKASPTVGRQIRAVRRGGKRK